MSEGLASAAAELADALERNEVDTIEIWYCHNAHESEPVAKEVQKAADTADAILKRRYPNLEISTRSLEVGLEKLGEWYESTRSPILVSDEIAVPVDGWFEEVGDQWTSICTSVPASWLTDLHARYDDKLFSANVRGYMPSRRTARNINYNMELTARERPGHFWAFNNGATALVHDYVAPTASGPNSQLTVRGLAIVNGAQTTGALSRAAGPHLEDAAVMIRFVRCEDDDLVDQIIRFNNSQNPIKASDFRSSDRHQDRLRSEFGSIPDATYLGARRGGLQDRARRPSNLIPSDTAAQALAAFHAEPGIAYHELRAIWERDEIYSRFFSDFTKAEHIVFAYALLSAIQDAKARLLARAKQAGEAALSEDDRAELGFFRRRGSTFLLTTAIAACVEAFLDKAVPDRFALSFGTTVSPAVGKEYWKPIVDVMLPFVGQLRDAGKTGSLRPSQALDDAIELFRAVVRSTQRANEAVFKDFALRVAS
jgi:hypothetical protein